MTRVNIYKKGIRVLGIAESFRKGVSRKAVLVGIVMRGDFLIDGFNLGFTTVGGLDSTDKIIELYKNLNRTDIGAILLNGCIISWFNIVDLERVFEDTGKPVICITYEESDGIDRYLMEYFPDSWEKRLEIHKRNGDRVRILLKTRHQIYIQAKGISTRKALILINKFTKNGAIPEPLRVAKIIDVKDHPQADKLYMLHLDLGALGKRVIVAGMKPYYTKEEINNKNIVIVSNLKPATIRGITSNGMLLAADNGKGKVVLVSPGDAKPGSEVLIEGIPREPAKILEFDDFLKIKMKVGDKNEIIYNEKNLKTEKGKLYTDREIEKGSKIS